MIKNVTFQGLTTTPSSHESQDGELAACMNLIPEDGSIKPMHQPYTIGEMEDGAQLWVHETPDYLHYIKRLADGTWWWSSNLNADEYNSDKLISVYAVDYQEDLITKWVDPEYLATLLADATPILEATKTEDEKTPSEVDGINLMTYTLIVIESNVSYVKAYKADGTELKLMDYKEVTIDDKTYHCYWVLTTETEAIVKAASKAASKDETVWNVIEGIEGTNVNDVAYNGNILTIAMDDQPIQYIVWKAYSDDYRYLGQIPKVDMEFKLEGGVKARNYKAAILCGQINTETDGEEMQNYTDLAWLIDDQVTVHNISWTDLQNHNIEATKTYLFVAKLGRVINTNSDAYTQTYYYKGYIECTYPNGKTSTAELRNEDVDDGSAGMKDVSKEIVMVEGMSIRLWITWEEDDTMGGHDEGNAYASWRIMSGDGEAAEVGTGYYLDNSSADNLMGLIGLTTKYSQMYCENKGKFVYPFYLRYALKLYDGTYVYASAPTLMIPNWGVTPRLLVRYKTESTDATKQAYSDVHAQAFTCDLYYKITNLNNLSDWEDIITDIVLSISAPINHVDGNVTWVEGTYQAKCYKKVETNFTQNYGLIDSAKTFLWDNLVDVANDDFVINPPLLEDQAFLKHMQNVMSGFYKLHNIKREEAETDTWNKINTTGFNIMYPETGIEVKVDSLANELLYAEKLQTYNGRQHLINVREQLNTYGCAISQVLPSPYYRNYYYRMEVETKKNGQKYEMWTDEIEGNPTYALYFYSNDPDVYNVTVYLKSDAYTSTITQGLTGITETTEIPAEYRKATLKATSHEVIDGAYTYLTSGLTWVDSTEDEYNIESTDTPIVSHANEIYVSEADNPFVYPSANAVQCGRGEVLNVGVNTETISEGQFGEAPLYAFTTEETWVLSLADSGVYQTKQVLANTVCINPDNVTPLSSGCVFTTVNGIMYAAGKQVTCISDVLRDEIARYTLPHLGAVMEARELLNQSDYLPRYGYDGEWLTFLKSCHMSYDKVNDRLLVCPDGADISYVYSFRSNQWGMQGLGFTTTIDKAGSSWILQDMNGMQLIQDLSNPTDAEEPVVADVYERQYLITRPMGIEDPDVMKRIKAMIVRGNFRKGNVACALYGSRDLFTWRLIHTSVDQYLRGMSGTPYKYLIAVVVSGLLDDERLSGVSFEYDNVMYNQLR